MSGVGLTCTASHFYRFTPRIPVGGENLLPRLSMIEVVAGTAAIQI
jgi:hypothetical protein